MVEEVELQDQPPPPAAAAGGGELAEENLKNDVYTAAAYGDLEKLHRLVEEEGCSVCEPDGLGYYALQWAALNNRAAAAQYIIEVILVIVSSFMCLLQFLWFCLVTGMV